MHLARRISPDAPIVSSGFHVAVNPMEKQRLLTLLRELHDELAGAEQLDPDARAAVATIAADAERLLHTGAGPAGEAASSEAPGDGEGTLANQLRERLREFGADHPQLAKALNQVADGLSGLGI